MSYVNDFLGNEINIGDRVAYMSSHHMKAGVVERITITKHGKSVRIKLDATPTRVYSNKVVLRDGRRFVKVSPVEELKI